MKLEELEQLNDVTALKDLLIQLIQMVDSLQTTIKSLQATIEKKDVENAELRRLIFGRKSERMPSIQSELKKSRTTKQKVADKGKTVEKRAANRKAKKELPTEEIVYEVDEGELVCPLCNGTQFKELSEGELSDEYEYQPPRLVRRKIIRKKMACQCGGHIVTAPGPVRVSEGVQYGPGFHSHVVVSKCADSLPLYRQEKRFAREGLKISRSTMCDIFHRTAALLEPLHKRILELIEKSRYVGADETPQPVMDKDKTHRGYMWNFNAEKLVAYVFSHSRSGDTPVNVLKNSRGYLNADAYSGYNKIKTSDKRIHAGCWGHARRRFFQAKQYSPKEAGYALEKILELYQVEYLAAEKECLGKSEHLAMRKAESKRITDEFKKWLEKQKSLVTPKSPMGTAIGYALNNWKSLTRFLEDANLPLDNNRSERLLRTIALGRKNFLFVGNNGAGHNLAILQTLVSSCQINDVDPQAYLTDMLIRIQSHPHQKIDELLPHNWKPPG